MSPIQGSRRIVEEGCVKYFLRPLSPKESACQLLINLRLTENRKDGSKRDDLRAVPGDDGKISKRISERRMRAFLSHDDKPHGEKESGNIAISEILESRHDLRRPASAASQRRSRSSFAEGEFWRP